MPTIRSIVALTLTLIASPLGAHQRAPLDIPALLNRYSGGDVSGVVAMLTQLDDQETKDLSKNLITAGTAWTNAAPQDRRRRSLIVAAFALEFEVARIEKPDWGAALRKVPCGRCVVAGAAALLSDRGAPDEAEHAWLLAAIALGETQRDRLFLSTRPKGDRSSLDSYDIAGKAANRFPNDSRFALARAFAATINEWDDWVEGGAPAPGTRLMRVLPAAGSIAGNAQRQERREDAAQQFNRLVNDLVVGMEARLRFAYLAFAAGDYDRAIAVAQSAVGSVNDDERYLARFIAGQSQQGLGQLDEAMREFEQALQARPHAQSATIALAALRLRMGQADAAIALIGEEPPRRRDEDDPWRLFPYGNYGTLPQRMTAMRAAVMR